MKKALITGITGQDGSYLTELLLEKGYQVHGMVRRCSCDNFQRIDHLLSDITLHDGDLNDALSLRRIMSNIEPHEVYNLAAMSHVGISFETPEYAANVDGVGVLRLLDTVKQIVPQARFYQASTSELYGKVHATPQDENTPFHPRSPYAVAKLFAYWSVINYREAYKIYACNGILFNHESPRRGANFVTRKITMAVARIAAGLQSKLVLGNLDAKRDWGFAKDFVEGMWLMLQQSEPDDYVLSTGNTTSVRHFAELAFSEIGIEIVWEGKGVDEIGKDRITGKTLVEVSSQFFRPAEVDLLLGNSKKAQKKLGWAPKTTLKQLVQLMIKEDIKLIEGKSLSKIY